MLTAAGLVTARYHQTHARILALLADLDDEQLAWCPPGGAHSLAWIAWHLARWADHLQAHLTGLAGEPGGQPATAGQVWQSEQLAARWGLDPALLGEDETGMLMADADAFRLPLPGKATLLEYLQRTFALAERAVEAIDEHTFLRRGAARETDQAAGTVGDAILAHLTHDNRHLGEIECLRGLQGMRGTATS